jgi:hypothetical protein
LNDVETTQVGKGNTIGSETFRTQLKPLLFIASIFLLNFTARIIAAPLLPTIEKDLGFSHGDAGSLWGPGTYLLVLPIEKPSLFLQSPWVRHFH